MCPVKKEMMKRKFCDLVDNYQFDSLYDLMALIEEAATEVVEHG